MIIATYSTSPNFPASDQHPQAQRTTYAASDGIVWTVDYLSSVPIVEEMRRAIEPTETEVDSQNLAQAQTQFKLKTSEKFDPQFKAMRAGLRLLLQKLNATLPVIQRTTWPQFMTQWKAAIGAENDPET